MAIEMKDIEQHYYYASQGAKINVRNITEYGSTEFAAFTLRSSFSALKFTVPSEDCPVMFRAAPFTEAIRPLVSNTSPRPLMTRTICEKR